MAYTNRQKASFYFQKFNEVEFDNVLMGIYWELYKCYDNLDKIEQRLTSTLSNLKKHRARNLIRKPFDPYKIKLKK